MAQPARTKSKEMSLSTLALLWQVQKAAEDEARQTRIEIEEKIAALVPGPEEGTANGKDGNWKVTVTRKFNRSIDLDAYEELKDELPRGLIRLKPDLDLKVYRAVELANPEAFSLVQKVVTVKTAKASIKVEEVGK